MTPEDLKVLIESDAEALQAATEERWQDCAARCGVVAPLLHRPLTALELQRESSLSGFWAKIRLTAEPNSGAPAELRGVAVTFVDWIQSQFPIDLTLPELQPMVQGLVASGLLPQTEFDRMLKLTEQAQTFTPLECRVAIKGA